MILMNKQKNTDIGISEYDLASYLCNRFGIELKSEQFYIDYFKSFAEEDNEGRLVVKDRDDIPYKNCFDTDDGEYLFLDEYDNDFNMKDNLFLITPKSRKSLNSQFHRENKVYLNSSSEFKDGEIANIISVNGSLKLQVKLDDNIRNDCVLIYSGTKGVNNLTSSKHSLEGKNAIYQESKVELKRG